MTIQNDKDLSLNSFFTPRSIALIGASPNPTKLGYGMARNLVQSNYQGVVHFVNPRGGKLLGRPVYPSIAETPDPVDLAILLIPAEAVPGALRECGERGLKAAIIASGGFRETGDHGDRGRHHPAGDAQHRSRRSTEVMSKAIDICCS